MNEGMRTALLTMYKNLEAAAKKQEERGGSDQGERSKVTGGHHLDVVAEALRNDLIDAGYSPKDVYYKDGCLTLPGWFRPSKDWDLVAFDGNDLLATVELKSINSSFGNNCNNRSEESLGSAVDVEHAIKNELIPFQVAPPVVGYVMVVKMCEDSTKPSRSNKKAIYPIDKVFDKASYLQRLVVLCRRLLSERLYQAVWIVAVDPANDIVEEPDPNLSYDKFVATIAAQRSIHNA
jgi:hypothetical protein